MTNCRVIPKCLSAVHNFRFNTIFYATEDLWNPSQEPETLLYSKTSS